MSDIDCATALCLEFSGAKFPLSLDSSKVAELIERHVANLWIDKLFTRLKSRVAFTGKTDKGTTLFDDDGNELVSVRVISK